MKNRININGEMIPESAAPMNDDPKGFEIVDSYFSKEKSEVSNSLKSYKGEDVSFYYFTISALTSGEVHIVRVLKKLP
jgi:hypothetical protein